MPVAEFFPIELLTNLSINDPVVEKKLVISLLDKLGDLDSDEGSDDDDDRNKKKAGAEDDAGDGDDDDQEKEDFSEDEDGDYNAEKYFPAKMNDNDGRVT